MPLEQVSLVTVATCDLCRTSAVHASSSESPIAREYFLGLGWSVVEGTVPVVDEFPVNAEAWFCPRCTPLILAGTVTGISIAGDDP